MSNLNLLSLRRAAECAGVPVGVLRAAIRRGEVAVIVLGGRYHVNLADVDAWAVTTLQPARRPAPAPSGPAVEFYLVDPRDPAHVCPVGGRTRVPLAVRLRGILWEARHPESGRGDPARNAWVTALLRADVTPLIQDNGPVADTDAALADGRRYGLHMRWHVKGHKMPPAGTCPFCDAGE